MVYKIEFDVAYLRASFKLISSLVVCCARSGILIYSKTSRLQRKYVLPIVLVLKIYTYSVQIVMILVITALDAIFSIYFLSFA